MLNIDIIERYYIIYLWHDFYDMLAHHRNLFVLYIYSYLHSSTKFCDFLKRSKIMANRTESLYIGWDTYRLKFELSAILNLAIILAFFSLIKSSILLPLNVMNRFKLEQLYDLFKNLFPKQRQLVANCTNMLYWVRHLTIFFSQLMLISWMVTLSSCLFWQIICFLLPPYEYVVYTFEQGWEILWQIDIQEMPILAKKIIFSDEAHFGLCDSHIHFKELK